MKSGRKPTGAKKCLFIDDERMPPVAWKNFNVFVARNYDDAIELLKASKNNPFDIVSFDHDLGEGKTGYDIAKYILIKQIPMGGFLVHSMNPVGKKNIETVLTHYGYNLLN